MLRSLRLMLVMRCWSSKAMTRSGRSKSMLPCSVRRALRKRASSFIWRKCFDDAARIARSPQDRFRGFCLRWCRSCGRRNDDAAREARALDVAVLVEFDERAHDQAVFLRLERADAVGKSFGKHGDGAVGEIDAGAAQASFLVERGAVADVVRDVGDMHLQVPRAIFATLDVHGVVEVAGGFAVDGDDGEVAKVFAVR